jgi:energy-coupling factor transporter ATP-binding protein EcfA2
MTIASERQALVAGELRHVNKWYGDHHVLIDVSVRVARGEIVALIGRSGSGKSTVPLSELSALTLNVGDQKGGTEALLRAAGALDNLPYKIAFSTFTSGPPQIEAATAGKIDFAITGNSPPIFGAASNAKVKVVAAYDGGGNGDQIVVHADSPIRSISDLRGKSIAVGKGSSAHGHILGQLEKAGLSTSDVTLVFLQPADPLSAFTKRQAKRGPSGIPTPRRPPRSCRCAASDMPGTSPTAIGLVSRRTKRSRTRSATPLSPIFWCVTKRRRGGPRTTRRSGPKATPPLWDWT